MSFSTPGAGGGAEEMLSYYIRAIDLATPVFRAFGAEVSAITKKVQADMAEMSRSLQGQARVATATAREQAAASDRVAKSSTVAADAQTRAAAKGKVAADSEVSSYGRQASAAQVAADKQVTAAAKSEAAFGRSGSALSKFGGATILATAAVSAASLDMATKFQANTLRMQTQAGATTTQLARLRQGLLDMAGQVGFSPNRLADGLYHVVSSMNAILPPAQRVSTELSIMKIAAEGAQVGHANLEETTYALASAMNALHGRAKDVGNIMGTINATVGAGDMTMQDFIDSLRSGLLPAARESGITLQSVGAALAVMGDMGMRGALAGTRLRMAIALMSSPSAQAAKILQTLGMNAHEASSTSDAMAKALEKAGLRTTSLSSDLHKPNGILTALTDLRQHLIDSGLTATGAAAVMDKAFGGARTGATITLLSQNVDRLNLKYKQIGQSAGQFGSDWAATSKTFRVEVDKAVASVEALGIKIGNWLMPYATTALHGLEDMAKWLGRNKAAMEALGGAVIAFSSVAIGAYLFSKLKGAIKLIGEFGSSIAGAGRWLLGMGPGGAAPAGGGAAATGVLGGGLVGFTGTSFKVGSQFNPIAVRMAGMGLAGGAINASDQAAQEAQGFGPAVKAEQSAAARVAAQTPGGVLLPPGSAARAAATSALPTEAAIASSEAAASTSMLAGLKDTLKSGFSSLMRGGMLAGGGMLASQLAGSAIGGKTGHAVSTIGTDASIGAGLGSFLGPEGTLAGGVLGGLIGAFKTFVNEDASKYGNEIAGRLVAPLPGAVASHYRQGLSDALNSAHQAATAAATAASVGNPGVSPRAGALLRTGPSQAPALDAAALQQYWNAGWLAGNATVQGLQTVKHPSEFILFHDFKTQLAALPPQSRNEALKVMLTYASSLEQNGKLPKGAVDKMIKGLEQPFPAFQNFLLAQGIFSEKTLASAMKFTAAEGNLKNAVATFRTTWGDFAISQKLTDGNIVSNTAQAMSDLRAVIKTSTGQQRRDAEAEYKQLQATVANTFQSMLTTVSTKQAEMSKFIKAGSVADAQVAATNFANFDTAVTTAMQSGVINVNKGSQLIEKALNNTLKAFGGKTIPAVAAVTAGSIVGATNRILGSVFGGHATGGRVERPTYVVGEEAPAHPEYVLATNPAYRQRNVGLWTEAGHHLGIPGFVRGGTPGGSSGGGSNANYIDPIPGFHLGRTDMGVDASAAPGTPIVAMGDSRLTGVIQNWYAGQPLLNFQLLNGPDTGRYWYVAEQITPVTENIGATFKEGQVVARFASSGTGIEIGWAGNASGATLAQTTTGYSEGSVTPAGAAFAALLAGLGVGKTIGGGPFGGGFNVPTLKAPHVSGSGTIAHMVQTALDLATKAANSKLTAEAAAFGGGLGTVPSTSGPVSRQIYQAATALGYNKLAAAGLIGNAYQESSLNPSLNVPGGIGLFSWNVPSNPQGYQVKLGNVGQQIALATQAIGPGGVAAMNASGSPGAAAVWFETHFEHAGTPMMANRISAANSAFAQGYAKGGQVDYAGAFGTGGSYTANKPTMAIFGENGPETATFMPHRATGGRLTDASRHHHHSSKGPTYSYHYDAETGQIVYVTAAEWSHMSAEIAKWRAGQSQSRHHAAAARRAHNARLAQQLTDPLMVGRLGAGTLTESRKAFEAAHLPAGSPLSLLSNFGGLSNSAFGKVTSALGTQLTANTLGQNMKLANTYSSDMVRTGPDAPLFTHIRHLTGKMDKLIQKADHRQHQADRLHKEALAAHGRQRHQLMKTAHEDHILAHKAREKANAIAGQIANLDNKIASSRTGLIAAQMITAAMKGVTAAFTAQQAQFTKALNIAQVVEGLPGGSTARSLGLSSVQLKASGLTRRMIRSLAGSADGTNTGAAAYAQQVNYLTRTEIPQFQSDAKRLARLYHDALRTHNKKLQQALLTQLDAVTQAQLKAYSDLQTAQINKVNAQVQAGQDKASGQQSRADILASVQNMAPGTNLSRMGLTPKVLKSLGFSAQQIAGMAGAEGSGMNYLQELMSQQNGTLTAAQIGQAKAGVNQENAYLGRERTTEIGTLNTLEGELPHLKGAARKAASAQILALTKSILTLTDQMNSNTKAVSQLTQATAANTSATGQMTGTTTFTYNSQGFVAGMSSDNAMNTMVGN